MTTAGSHPGPRADAAGAKPRILLFVSNLGVGGAERHTVKLRACLRDRGYPTSLLVHGPHRSAVITALDGSEGAVHLDIKGVSNPMGWLRIWRAFHAQQADIVIAINQTPLIVAILSRVLRATRAKIACIFHTTIPRPNEERRLGLFRWGIGRADALVYISRNQQRYWEGHGLRCRCSATILNGIDLDRFASAPQEREAARARLGFLASDVVFGLVAAFRPEKNHGQLVEAVARLRQEGIPAKVVFVGDGPTRATTEARAAALGLAEHVVFAGEQADVRPWIAAADAGVLCSTSVETFSLAALEVLASGVPMVMSDIGGASEIVEDGVNGYLFEAGNTENLVERLRSLCDPDTRQRMRRAARPSVERYTVDRMIAAYESLALELAAEGSGRAAGQTRGARAG